MSAGMPAKKEILLYLPTRDPNVLSVQEECCEFSTQPTDKLDPNGEAGLHYPSLTLAPEYIVSSNGLMRDVCDASTLTDISSNQDLPEVEIISLIEEHIPRYRLRADTLTTFSGYENEDWFIPAPALPPDLDVDLSPEQAEETLKYFALCANRVSQMTKTYNDIDAVTRLLEEKEKDLELAARIGQSLLSRNKILEQKNDQLEQELNVLNEQVTQLRYELSMKTDLLQIYTQDLDYSESDSSAGTPTRGIINWEILHKKVKQLEDENTQLRSEVSILDTETETFEEKEQQLVNDCVKQLAEANLQIKQLSEDLSKKIDDNLRQQEEITSLLAQVVDWQKRTKKLQAENEDIQTHLQASKECQQELTSELADFKDKYAEIAALLHEAQEQLRNNRRKGLPSASKRPYGLYSSYVNPESLASELESSLGSDVNYDSLSHEKQHHNLKVFETVRYTRQKRSGSSLSSPAHMTHLYQASSGPGSSSSAYSSAGGGSSTLTTPAVGTETSLFLSSSPSLLPSGPPSLDGTGHSDSESSVITDSYSADNDSLYSSTLSLGRPGVPGSNDLETALRRLSLRRQSEHEFQLHDRRRPFDLGSDGTHTPTQCRTPDSIMSTGSGLSAFSGGSGPLGLGFRHYHIPEKLQIIKPMEGSLTLHHWQRLATPHLGGIFEERPGVQIKGERKLEDLDDVYTITDYEEDEDFSNPGKSFENTGTIYTYTTSTIMHPDDNTHVTPSLPPTQMTVSAQSSALNSPQGRERATSTFSTTFGLAKLLNERGISAAIPRVISRPPSPNHAYSPTATPCNSPEGSPPPSPPPFSPLRIPSIMTLGSSMCRGSDLLRRRKSVTARSKHSKRAPTKSTSSAGNYSVSASVGSSGTNMVSTSSLASINLLDKLNRIGLENIMSTSVSQKPPLPPAVAAVPPSSHSLAALPFVNRTSPMAQLTSIRRLTGSTSPLSISTKVGPMPSLATLTTTTNTVMASSCIASTQELGTIGTLSSLRKGGLSL